jgi:hypothetical protein
MTSGSRRRARERIASCREGCTEVILAAHGFPTKLLVTPIHGYEPTREAAMAAFAKSWRRNDAAQHESEQRQWARKSALLPEALALCSSTQNGSR